MFRNLFFFATCVGSLVVVDQLRSPDRDKLPALVADFRLSEVRIPDQEELIASFGTMVEELPEISARVVDELPEIGARVDETVIRPGMQKIATVLQIGETPATGGSFPKLAADQLTKVVNFDLNAAELDDEAKAQLDKLAGVLEENPAATLAIYGHTDLVGDAAYNMELGRVRAEKVAEYLTAKGIARDRIQLVKSYGESAPLIATDKPIRDNRRVQIEQM